MIRSILTTIFVLVCLSIPTAYASSNVEQPYGVITTFTFKPESMAKVKPILEEAIIESRNDDGCIQYVLLEDPNTSNQLMFMEIWESSAAHEKHTQSSHFIRTRAQLEAYYKAHPTVKTFNGAQANHTHRTPKNELFQVATIGSLSQGVYDGDFKLRQLEKHGDFGGGTFNHLNGEMVALDGKFYQIRANGKLREALPTQTTPFAQVVFFNPTETFKVSDEKNFSALEKAVSSQFNNKNVPYAIKIEGTFRQVKLRSLRQQQKPYPKLTKAASKQAEYELDHVRGTLVGFWFPQYWAGMAVPGFHMHFVNADKTTGGHVLAVNVEDATVSLEQIHQVAVNLPYSRSFASANLQPEDLQQQITQAEGDHKA